MKKIITSLASVFIFLLASLAASASEDTRMIPIQHGGQVKIFEAFAKDTLTLIHSRPSWQKKSAVDWMLSAIAEPKTVSSWQWIRIDYPLLKTTLRLPADRHHFSFEEVIPSLDKIEALGQSAEKKRRADESTSLLERKAESLYQALIAVKAIMDLDAFRVLPPAQGSSDPAWRTLSEDSADLTKSFQEIALAHKSGNIAGRDQAARAWTNKIHDMTGNRYRRVLSLEYFYIHSRPFGLAAIAYLLGFILLYIKRLRKIGVGLAILGFLLHTLGLVLRVLILGRPPVSNMYESMVWMNWVLMLSALILSGIRRDQAATAVGAIASAVVMIYGDLLPIDSGLDVLVPVLRSNYWLTIHVLTIVSSYGLFGLAMGLGHRHLWLHGTGKLNRLEEDRSAHLIYRAIQVGVLLLGIGTVLGGVWANESWGRFWGWDPKETWALITLLGYLVVIHLHFARVVKPFTLALSAIFGFLLVLFTWYGVNFVLGKGLHSYGQGSGGMNWVLLYLGVEIVFVAWALKFRDRAPGRGR